MEEEEEVMIVGPRQEHIKTRDTMAVETILGMKTLGMTTDMMTVIMAWVRLHLRLMDKVHHHKTTMDDHQLRRILDHHLRLRQEMQMIEKPYGGSLVL